MQIVENKGAFAKIILFFSSPMDPATVTDLQNYTLLDAGPDHEFSNRNDGVVPLKRATENALGDSVTLTLKKPASLGDSLCLILNSQSPSGLQDSNGWFLNGWGKDAPAWNGLLLLGKPPRNSIDPFLKGNWALLGAPTTLQAAWSIATHSKVPHARSVDAHIGHVPKAGKPPSAESRLPGTRSLPSRSASADLGVERVQGPGNRASRLESE
jgi:hypothetical protein